MFLPTRTCWSALQSALSQHSKGDRVKYILKIDVANYFGSMNLHTLINVLNDSGYASELSGRLEAVLTSYTSLRSSRGILQGMFPSDLFGNFYMEPIDRFLNEYGVKAARYVDDIYVFLDSVETAQKLLGQLIPKLRYYDLVLNEAKCMIIPKGQLQAEEPDAKFLDEEDVLDSLLELVVDGELSDWQKMWILAALSQAVEHADASVKVAMDLLQDANRHESLRAVAAIFVGRFGDHSRRLTLSSVYPTVSPYIQSAIYFSSRRWRKAERLTAKNNWGSHGQLNQLLTQALEKK